MTRLVFDGHNDLLWQARVQAGYDFDVFDPAAGIPSAQTDLPRLRAGGVGAQFWSVFVPADLAGDAAVTTTLEQVDAGRAMIARYPELAWATTADDVRAAWAQGRIASLLGAEGGHSIGGSLGVLRMLATLGVRYLTLTHNSNVGWADSATDAPDCGGLSVFGREVVAELNRLGMIVDLSHVAATTMADALAVTSAPVLFSHSSARALCDHPRNVPDDVLTRLPTNGGVCQVTFVPYFVNAAVRDWVGEAEAAWQATRDGPGEEPPAREPDPHVGLMPRRLRDPDPGLAFFRAWARRHPGPQADVGDVADHVEHVREVAGIDHVGLGGDYDGCAFFPVGLEDVSGYPRLLAELTARGWSDADLDRLTHENVLRVLADNPPATTGEAPTAAHS